MATVAVERRFLRPARAPAGPRTAVVREAVWPSREGRATVGSEEVGEDEVRWLWRSGGLKGPGSRRSTMTLSRVNECE
ncbi:hypothetical protein [Haladaptatus halobius]|uniref:hypothetical protein n=1 Tax=Haladaptatus halobius TaxID=2884875 RepID=UPI001D0BCCC7|nr:hypothetical protein [Haladaptatus halobius]